MRVSLLGLIAGGHSGIPRYAAALIEAIDRVAGDFGDLELTLVTTPAVAAQRAVANMQVAPVAGGTRGARRTAAEQLAAARADADLLHFFDLTAPALAPRRRFVSTIHDAAVRRGSEQTWSVHKRLLQPLSLRRAVRVVAVSDFARREASDAFGADASKIRTVHSGPGLAPATRGRSKGSDPLERTVCAGRRESGGAQEHPVPGACLLGRGRRGCASGHRAAAGGAARPKSTRPSPRRRARDRIQVRGDVTDAEVDGLYRGAAAHVFPSRYEGFGFTALEAMSRDCPVLASDIPALREISGDGAQLLPLDDVAAWAQAIRRVLTDPDWGDELRARGRATVARYSWETTARGVLDVLREAGGH